MRVIIMSTFAFIGAFGLAGFAPAASSANGQGGGAGAHGGGPAHGGSAAHEGTGHSTSRLGSRIPSMGLGTREAAQLARMGLADAYSTKIGGHDATVAVFHHAPLTAAERDNLHRYHFKGFNSCAGHEGCAEQVQAGEELLCRRARNVAITSDLECLSFRP
jgi:hypothetical protein